VRVVAVQPDGKILVGGNFNTVRGVNNGMLTRLNQDGSSDSGFTSAFPPPNLGPRIYTVGVQTNGRVLAAGQFTAVGGSFRTNIARLQADGSFDASFNSGAGPSALVRIMALQPDGRILVTGNFSYFNGQVCGRVVRLNTNCSIDPTFGFGHLGMLVRSDGAFSGPYYNLTTGNFDVMYVTTATVLDTPLSVGTLKSPSAAGAISLRGGRFFVYGQFTWIEGMALDVLYTPGHTDDSYCFTMADRVFTGDTLLIRGTGRTDFQNGDPRAQFDSIFNKLLRLPDQTMVFPAHDYKGEMVSTIGEERAFNPRLQVKSVDQYVELMSKLNLPNPKMMDVAVPANMRVGLAQEAIARQGWAVSAGEATTLLGRPDIALVDLRERTEREKHGVIPGSLHAPYPDLAVNVQPGGMLHELAAATGKRILFYCAFGERSAMAVQAAQDSGISGASHIQGGIAAWKKADGALVH